MLVGVWVWVWGRVREKVPRSDGQLSREPYVPLLVVCMIVQLQYHQSCMIVLAMVV